MPDARVRCAVCKKSTQDWAVYEAAVPFIFPRRNIEVKPGDLVCGDCLGHARRRNVISEQAHRAAAARPVNQAERARTAHEFLK